MRRRGAVPARCIRPRRWCLKFSQPRGGVGTSIRACTCLGLFLVRGTIRSRVRQTMGRYQHGARSRHGRGEGKPAAVPAQELRSELIRLSRKAMMKLTVACTLTCLMLLCAPVLACGTQLDPLPCESAARLGQTAGQFISAPRFRPVPSPRARARGNRRAKGGSSLSSGFTYASSRREGVYCQRAS